MRFRTHSGNSSSLRPQTQVREVFEAPGRDDEAVYAGRIEHEAEGGLRHRLSACRGRSSHLLDVREGLFACIIGAGFGRAGQAAVRRGLHAEPVLAGEEATRERAERGVAEAMFGAVGDQRLRVRGGEERRAPRT